MNLQGLTQRWAHGHRKRLTIISSLCAPTWRISRRPRPSPWDHPDLREEEMAQRTAGPGVKQPGTGGDMSRAPWPPCLPSNPRGHAVDDPLNLGSKEVFMLIEGTSPSFQHVQLRPTVLSNTRCTGRRSCARGNRTPKERANNLL